MKKSLFFVCIFASALTFFSCKKADIVPAKATGQSETAPVATQSAVSARQSSGYVVLAEGDGNKEIVLGREDPTECIATEVTLIAGQTMDAGTVTVSNDATNIYVTYTTTNGWVLTQTHLYVGDCALIPVNNPGNPIPGQFPFTSAHNNVTTYTYTVPISRIPAGGCGCIAAHAVVKQYNSSNQLIQTQTGWGNGVRINLTGGNWGMKFDYCSCIPE